MQHNQYSIPLFLRDLIKAGVCCYVCNYLTTNNEIFFCRKWKKVTSHSFESSLKLKWKKCSLQLNSVKWTVCKNVCSGICLSASSWNSDGGVWIPHIVYQWTLLSPGYFVFWYLMLFFFFFLEFGALQDHQWAVPFCCHQVRVPCEVSGQLHGKGKWVQNWSAVQHRNIDTYFGKIIQSRAEHYFDWSPQTITTP